MKEGLPPKENKEEEVPISPKEEIYSNNEKNDDILVSTDRYIKIPLTEEDMKMTAIDIAKKYNLSSKSGYFLKNRGYSLKENPNYTSNYSELLKEKKEIKEYIEEITPVQINSIETIFTNKEEQKMVKEIVEKYESLAYRINIDRDSKKYKLINEKELTAGDFVILNKLIDFKVFRAEDGKLMMYKKGEDKPSVFARAKFFNDGKGDNVFVFKDIFKNIDQDKPKPKSKQFKSLESFSPEIFKMGIFKQEDFDKNYFGSESYKILGPHERSLSKNDPYVYFSNQNTVCKYYIGRDNFNGTNKKINHETVKVSLLDNETGVITDIINDRKVILYTFPLLKQEETEKMKEEIINRRISQNKPIDEKSIKDNMTKKAELKEYLITDYISKNSNESDIDYANRISKLSDISYVLGNFRSFMSETGLAANNYSWREQLILADTLTSVEDKEKIIKFGNINNFGKNGLRTFLSVEQGGQKMGKKIISLGEKLQEDIARKVFTKYGEIIDTADKAEEEVKKLYEKENIPNEVFVSIKETLLNKGAELLSNLADKIDNSEEKIKEDDILKELEDIKTSTIIMGESYIELYKQGIKVPVEDIANTTLEKISSQNLSEENKKELLKVYENGRPKETYENKDHIKLLTEEFEQTLENKDTFVFNIRFNNEIVAFATFYKENEDTLHIGGLTFIDDVRNPAIGNAVMISIMNEFKNFNIKALVHSQNKVLAMYQKRFGFKIVKELPKEENAGELYYEIEKKKVSDSIQMDKDKIKEAA